MTVDRITGALRRGWERAVMARRELGWVAFGQAVAAVGSLAAVRVMTGLLGPSAYGEVALGMTAALLINQLLFGPLTNGVVRFYAPSVEANDLGSYLGAVRRLALLATLAAVVVGVVAAVAVAALLGGIWLPLVLSVLLYAILLGYNGLLSGIQNAARQRSVVALHQGLEAWTKVLCAVALVLLSRPSSSVAVHGYTLGIVVVLASQFLFFGKIRKRAGVERSHARWSESILRYSWPFCTWSIFSWAQLSADRWALGAFSGSAAVGLYAALYQLGNYPVTVATAMALQLIAPILYQRAGDGSDSARTQHARRMCIRVASVVLGLTVVIAALSSCCHALIFHIFVSPRYASVSSMLPWLLLGSGIFSASQVLELNLLSQMQSRRLIVAKIATALAGVALSFAGAYRYGIAGVVFAGLAFSLLYFIWVTTLSLRD